MISDRLIALVRCPECRGALARRPDAPGGLTCQGCGRLYQSPRDEYLDLRPADAFTEQTKYLDEALHADARHERVSPPLLGFEDPQRHAAGVSAARARRPGG